MKRFSLTLFSLFMLASRLSGQSIIRSQYEDIQTDVKHSTGLVNINVPLFSIQEGHLNIGIGANYTTSGIKVGDISSPIGLGWSLGGINSIVRIMKGMPDGIGKGRDYTVLQNSNDVQNFKDAVKDDLLDGESDVFALNLNGKSFKFVVRNNATSKVAILLEKSDVRIELKSSNGAVQKNQEIDYFEVTDTDGTIYTFNEKEFEAEIDNKNNFNTSNIKPGIPSQWYVSEIKSAFGEKITILYNSYLVTKKSLAENTLRYGRSIAEWGKDESLLAQLHSSNYAAVLTEYDKVQNYFDQLQCAERFTTQELDNTIAQYRDLLFFNQNVLVNDLNNSKLSALEKQDSYLNYVRNNSNVLYETKMSNLVSNLQSLESSKQVRANEYLFASSALQAAQYQQNQLMRELYSTATYVPVDIWMFEGENFLLKKYPLLIVSKNHLLKFSYKSYDQEKKYQPVLDQIVLTDWENTKIDSINFQYSYLSDQGDHMCSKKVFLKKIIKGSKTGLNMPYSFEYYRENHNLEDYKQDYWNYYCNNIGGLTPDLDNNHSYGLVPYFGYNIAPGLSYLKFFTSISENDYANFSKGNSGVNREPDSAYVKSFSLKTITSPLQGKMEFDYESNSLQCSGIMNSGGMPIIPSKNTLGGGIRIKAIKYFNKDKLVRQRRFTYEFNQTSTAFYIKKNKRSFDMSVNYTGMPESDNYRMSEPFDFSPAYFTSSNNDLFYTYVEESEPGKGKIGYRFLDFTASDSIYPYWLEDLLLSRTIFDDSGTVLKIEKKRYLLAQNDLVPYVNSKYLSMFDFDVRFAFNGIIDQYRPYPYKNIYKNQFGSSYENRDVGYGFNPYLQVYMRNIQPRLNMINNMPKNYTLRAGGNVSLSENVVWQANAGQNMPLEINGYDNVSLYSTTILGSGLENRMKYIYNGSSKVPVGEKVEAENGDRYFKKRKFVRDFVSNVSPLIDSLKRQNRLFDIVEEQNWVMPSGTATWSYMSGNIQTFQNIKYDTEFLKNVILPISVKTAMLAGPIAAAEVGEVNPENNLNNYNALNEPTSANFQKTVDHYFYVSPFGVRSSGSVSSNEVKKASIEDLSFTVSIEGANGDEVFYSDGIPNTRRVRRSLNPSEINDSNFGSMFELPNSIDKTEILQWIIKRNEYLIDNGWGDFNNILGSMTDFLKSAVRFDNLDSILAKYPLAESKYSEAGQNSAEFDDFYGGEITFGGYLTDLFSKVVYPLRNNLYPSGLWYSKNGGLYLSTLNGKLDYRKKLDGFKNLGRPVQFISAQPFSGVKLNFYQGESQRYQLSLNSSPMTNGLYGTTVDLATINNFLQFTDVEFDSHINKELILMTPVGVNFWVQLFDLKGNMIKQYDTRGEFTYYTYDELGRRVTTSDSKGNITGATEYNVRK
ncbi:RHS repeat domain-containing protein [Sphingobacterium multivorum]|uniref:RHS repeat domain-containing protein n=1 Tax=Sphingobacterium multivorum TaxID=28454 RepID=UPI0031B9CA62